MVDPLCKSFLTRGNTTFHCAKTFGHKGRHFGYGAPSSSYAFGPAGSVSWEDGDPGANGVLVPLAREAVIVTVPDNQEGTTIG